MSRTASYSESKIIKIPCGENFGAVLVCVCVRERERALNNNNNITNNNAYLIFLYITRDRTILANCQLAGRK